ncbi:protein Lilipod [Culicoides brevitarsis]|uniref:protein Lilipod n=1 Tax=Culicoides brevitarsis TaxID=469753 RepID=UPI00307B56BE
MEIDEEDDFIDIHDERFHASVRENIIFLLLFMILYVGSYALIGRFRRRDKEDLFSTDEDEIIVYRISLWLCTFSLAIAIAAGLLLPISIASNEVLLLYPKSYYVKWLNSSLISGLWNYIFLFSNLSLFVFLPFAYLFAESSGFFGSKSGLVARAYETMVVFTLLAFIVLGLTFILSAWFDPERSNIQTLLNVGSYYLPFLYSCVSFSGVLLLLVFTPLGFVRLFGVVGQVLVKPHLMREVNDEYYAFNFEEASIKRKLAQINPPAVNNGHGGNNVSVRLKSITSININPAKLCSGTDDLYQIRQQNGVNVAPVANGINSSSAKLTDRLKELECERKNLDKLRSSSAFQRNFVYPVAMLLLLALTGITVLLVAQNTIELLIGIKALPLSSRQFTLGIMSLSKLGPLGAALEFVVIIYLSAASTVGLYTMPSMQKVRPKYRETSLSILILNCALVLILSSAFPLLARILGITNFDLLGDYGEIEWLGSFSFVFLYNVVFATAAGLIIFFKFTTTVRNELIARLTSLLGSIFGIKKVEQHILNTHIITEEIPSNEEAQFLLNHSMQSNSSKKDD